jgi:glutathione S-transferase
MLEWMFWEQYTHEPTIAVRRYHKIYLQKTDSEIDAALLPKGHAALERLERQLSGTEYLVGESMTAADICLFPYTMLAPQGGFNLVDYPGTRSWLARIAGELAVAPNVSFENATTAAANAA